MGLGPLSQLPVHPTQEPTNSLCSVFTAWSTKAVWMSSLGPRTALPQGIQGAGQRQWGGRGLEPRPLCCPGRRQSLPVSITAASESRIKWGRKPCPGNSLGEEVPKSLRDEASESVFLCSPAEPQAHGSAHSFAGTPRPRQPGR